MEQTFGQRLSGIFLISALSACHSTPSITGRPGTEAAPGSYAHGATALQLMLEKRHNTQTAEGVILFLGDGMSLSTVTAGRIFAGQQAGLDGESHQLAFERFPHVGLVKTYNTNRQVPDSAGTMTAIATGTKTRAGTISVSPNTLRSNPADCNNNELTTLLEIAEEAGWATGIVTTTRITHATPAAAYAHSPDRDWESDADMPGNAAQHGCRDIARQLVEFNAGDGLDVVFGGGKSLFLPKNDGTSGKGKRLDGRNLIQQWQSAAGNRHFIDSAAELQTLSTDAAQQVLGLFSNSHMAFEHDRAASGEPSLSDMTLAALKQLQSHPRFILIVESGRIDHAHHMGNAYRALAEMAEFDKTIAAVASSTGLKNTLIIVTADHSHTMTIGGNPTRGNPILGFVKENDASGNTEAEPTLALDAKPYTTLNYANGAGYCSDYEKVGIYGCFDKKQRHRGRHTTANDNPEHPNYHQEANLPLAYETHAGEDVPIYATGPWAHLLNGVIEQNVIFHVIKHAAGL